MHKINTTYTLPLDLVASGGTPVSGAVLYNFNRKLLDGSGTDQTSMLSLAEIVETPSKGRYYASFTPNSAGLWKLWLSYSSGSIGPIYDESVSVNVYDSTTYYRDSTKKDTPYVFTMRLTTLYGQAISGAVTADFSRLVLDPNGSDRSTLLAVTEVTADSPSQGRYYGTLTPDIAGEWKVWVTYTSGSTLLMDYNSALTVTIGDVLAETSSTAMSDMVTRCRTQYAQLATGMTMYVSYKKFTDGEWESFITDALDAFNGCPPNFTVYTIDNLPIAFRHYVKDYAVLNALLANEIFEAGKHFIYSDNGISFTRDQHGKFSATRAGLLSSWFQIVQALKKILGLSSLHPSGQFSGTAGMPRSLDRSLRGVRKWQR